MGRVMGRVRVRVRGGALLDDACVRDEDLLEDPAVHLVRVRVRARARARVRVRIRPRAPAPCCRARPQRRRARA